MNPSSGAIFVDTSGWADPILQNTPYFAQMRAFSQQLLASGRSVITTNYVLAELVALLTTRSHLSRDQVLLFLDGIMQMAQLQIVHVDPAQDADAWAMLHQNRDKDWSLVDAASFVVMRQMGINEAFTSDHHFAQAGFIRLPHVP